MLPGLTTKEALDKQKQYGKNEITTQTKNSPLFLFFSQFPTTINAILALAGLFSFIIGNTLDGFFIFAVLVINALFSFFQEYKAEKALEKLKSFITPLSHVMRDGKQEEIETINLVPGDIVKLFEGDRIPADGVLLENHHLEVDESILTGESLPVLKELEDPLLSGTLVTKGRGTLIVQSIGLQTRFGRIAETLSSVETDKTPLQIKLASLGKGVSFLAIFVAFLLIPLGIYQEKPFYPLILTAVSIGIAAIPEGLPAILTIALSIGTHRMAKKHAIIRKMPAVETLGAVQFVLIDKTGTLTQNIMSVRKHFLLKQELLPHLLQACLLGNTASLIEKNDGDKKSWDVVGNQTDGALLLWATRETKDGTQIDTEGEIVDEYTFNREDKTIAVILENKHKRFVFVRGAPEKIIEKSVLTRSEKENAQKEMEAYAKEGLRVIGFGYKQETHPETKREHVEKNLTFLGLVGLYDPPRPEVRASIQTAKQAGVQPIMVTGDNELTALTIAKEIGLIEKDEDVITGEELAKLSDEQLQSVLLKTRIFARSKPEDKLRLVNAYKKAGFVVGVTGDGVNDSLALKRADVGIAMGSGTDVAKDASDIVLTDNNFTTILHAISEGRTIYHNILTAITYLLAGNLSELFLILFASLLALPDPLLPTQILWINIVTDGIPALALASDVKDSIVLRNKPRDPKAPFLTKRRILFIAGIGTTMAISLVLTFNFLLQSHSEQFARTVVFNLLVILHLPMALLVRERSPFRVTRFLLLAILGTLVIQILITTVPFFQTIFHLKFY